MRGPDRYVLSPSVGHWSFYADPRVDASSQPLPSVAISYAWTCGRSSSCSCRSRVRPVHANPCIPLVLTFCLSAHSPVALKDMMLNDFLIATWAKVCQALREEFERYLRRRGDQPGGSGPWRPRDGA